MMKIFLAVVVALIPNVSGKPADCPEVSPMSSCPDPFQSLCPQSYDQNGCKMPRQCVYPKYGKVTGVHCPIHETCPQSSCKLGEMACDIPPSEEGCNRSFSCQPSTTPITNPITGLVNNCPAYCPVNCPKDQVNCGPKSDDQGCPMEEVCATTYAYC
eukprot:00885.XXX_2378_1765_1 [CDS] Oithona nana genome sequencing.